MYNTRSDYIILNHSNPPGIPEVDLGISSKIENIEKTDKALGALEANRGNSLNDDNLPRNYTHDYSRLDAINKSKSTLNILKDDRYN